MTFYHSNFSEPAVGLGNNDKLVSTISMLGATLVGVGALLAVGANWDFIPQLLKIAVIVLATLSAYAGGWYLKTPSGGKPRIGEALIFLGSVLYGVGIWLMSQIYGYETHYSWGVLLWALGIIPVAMVARSGVIAVLACSLLNYWLFMEPYSLLHCGIWATLSFSLAYFVRSPWALSKGLVGAALWSVEQAHLGCGALVFLSLAMCASFLFHVNTKNLSIMAKPFLYIGSFFTLASLLFLTDERGRMFYADGRDPLAVCIIAALLVVSLIVALVHWNRIYPELIGCATLALAVLGLNVVDDSILRNALSHGLLMITILGFVSASTLRFRDNVITVMSSMFFSVAVAVLYFDSRFTMSDRSMFLLFGGFLLLTVSTFGERVLLFRETRNDSLAKPIALTTRSL